MRTSQGLTRAESIQRLDQLKQHLIDLERQYDKSKPMVNLVDNMVKLGSLYRNNDSSSSISRMNDPAAIERYEYNQRLQEKRMLAEEEKQFERQHASQKELQVSWEPLELHVYSFQFDYPTPKSTYLLVFFLFLWFFSFIKNSLNSKIIDESSSALPA